MTETPIDFHSFASPQELAENLATTIADKLTKAVAQRGNASLVVSGGSTPKPLFEQLSSKKNNWDKVTITLADERWVETSDPASNENLVRALLLQNEAVHASFIGLKNKASSAAEGEQESHDLISTIPKPFDIVILGLGDDGHTASLFPGSTELDKAVDMHLKHCCIALSPPNASYDRMSLTLPVLIDSREIILHITGENKKKVLEAALNKGPSSDMPVRYILRQQVTPVKIYWAP